MRLRLDYAVLTKLFIANHFNNSIEIQNYNFLITRNRSIKHGRIIQGKPYFCQTKLLPKQFHFK